MPLGQFSQHVLKMDKTQIKCAHFFKPSCFILQCSSFFITEMLAHDKLVI